MKTHSSEPGPGEIPKTPLLAYFRSKVFAGPKGDRGWGDRRIEEAERLRDNPDELAERFRESVAMVERVYRNYQPLYPVGHHFKDSHGGNLTRTVDVAKRLSSQEVWEVRNDPRLNFRYIDREIEIARAKPTPTRRPAGSTLIVDLFLANARDRMPILCELKIAADQCSLYALIQLLTQAAYAATPSQRERLVLFGSTPDFVLREALPRDPGRLDLYILLVNPKAGSPHAEIKLRAMSLSRKLERDARVSSKIRRIAWLEGHDDGQGGLTLSRAESPS